MNLQDDPKLQNVIYIVSSGHSGSTILDITLGRLHDVAGFGELSALPEYILQDKDCTCGAPLMSCPFWMEIRRMGGLDGIRGTGRDARRQTIHDNRRLYEALSRVSGATNIVDSSKSTRRLGRIIGESIPTKVIYLIRDPRAVAFSHVRKGRSFFSYLVKWSHKQDRIERFLRNIDPGKILTIRYEDFALSHLETIERLKKWIEVDRHMESLAEYPSRQLHNIDGNRTRFRNSDQIRFDSDFIDRLNPLTWIIASSVTRRYLKAHNYPTSKRGWRRLASLQMSSGGGMQS